MQNPQANAILERIHQVIANMVRTFELEDNYLDEDDPWAGIIAATACAVRSTHHAALQATPGQLVFGRDVVFNVQHEANWNAIKRRKQHIINKSNARENRNRKDYTNTIGDKVLPKLARFKCKRLHEGPYEILEVHDDGTVTIKRGNAFDRMNIQNIHPFKQK